MSTWAEQSLHGWGHYPVHGALVARPESPAEVAQALREHQGRGLLAYGLGRSYGDAPLLEGGQVLRTERLDRMLSFDDSTGWARIEAGVTVEDLARTFAPRGWFPPVVPGTWYVTAAGALANDIHGKNHHLDGTWADHVRRVELLTASGEVVVCDAEREPDLFWATVGGLGLTGLILSMEVRMVPIPGPYIEVETVKVRDLDHFFQVSAESGGYSHTVSWIDTTTRGRGMGRGHFMRGRWTAERPPAGLHLPRLTVPFDAPNALLNRATITLFNEAYYQRQRAARVRAITGYEPFFFPLDAVDGWNRAYGPRGFLQYQLVVPHDPERRAIRAVMEAVTRSGMASFLAVIKEFGDRIHPHLSFPRPGVTLAMDFPNRGRPLLDLFDRLDRIVLDAGGRLYLGKDARLSRDTFRAMYPEWEGWRALRDTWDPEGVFRSSLGRRLGLCKEDR
ncbi:MAG: FAD-binding oxidoreductase [Deltaproteobacteria bacterium]|nr:FAD-binding oxidoreductase [Deltaproteobacteria bacterium]